MSGPVLLCDTALSFWGGVHPETGRIVDAYHPQHGETVAGRVVMMPSSRGSCTGSAVLLGLAQNGNAPAAFVFRESEDVLTLGAIISNSMYGGSIAVIRLANDLYDRMALESTATLANGKLIAGDISISLVEFDNAGIALSTNDQRMLDGFYGPAVQLAMETICTICLAQGGECLLDISRGHIDGCIYASPANLVFAQTMLEMGGRVRVPTTMNAISIDYANWQLQGIDPDFGVPARNLADAYVAMGAEPSFSCAPYLRDDKPEFGEAIAWAESNAVIYANSVLGARTNKHADFLDLFIALTGRAPEVGMYRERERRPTMFIDVQLPEAADESVWPLLGWISGNLACDQIPLLKGLAGAQICDDDLKALCAAFGTTSGVPMLHIEGVTPEADCFATEGLPGASIGQSDIAQAWLDFNSCEDRVDLVALGSPHLSIKECEKFAVLMQGQRLADGLDVIMTVGRDTQKSMASNGILLQLQEIGIQVVTDICWCSITRPLFPASAKTVMTNSGKYAHYGPGLSGCSVLFGSLAECAKVAITGHSKSTLPAWLENTI